MCAMNAPTYGGRIDIYVCPGGGFVANISNIEPGTVNFVSTSFIVRLVAPVAEWLKALIFHYRT